MKEVSTQSLVLQQATLDLNTEEQKTGTLSSSDVLYSVNVVSCVASLHAGARIYSNCFHLAGGYKNTFSPL